MVLTGHYNSQNNRIKPVNIMIEIIKTDEVDHEIQ